MSKRLDTLPRNGSEPRQRTGKQQLDSSFATSVNMRSICFCTLLFTHSTPYSMKLDAVVVVVVIVRVTFICLLAEERVESARLLAFAEVPKLPRWLLPRFIEPAIDGWRDRRLRWLPSIRLVTDFVSSNIESIFSL